MIDQHISFLVHIYKYAREIIKYSNSNGFLLYETLLKVLSGHLRGARLENHAIRCKILEARQVCKKKFTYTISRDEQKTIFSGLRISEMGA